MCKPFKWDDSSLHPLLRMSRFFKRYSQNPELIEDLHSSDSSDRPPDLNKLFERKVKKRKPLPKVVLKKPI